VELKDEVAVVCAKVAPLEEEVRQLRVDLLAMTDEQDKSRHQATEASSQAYSLARDLEAEQSEVKAKWEVRVATSSSIWFLSVLAQCLDYPLELRLDLDTSIKTYQTLSQAVDQNISKLKNLSDAVAYFGQSLGAGDVPLGESLWSHMQALSGYVRSELLKVIHRGVKRVLVVVVSHYEINLERVCEGYVLRMRTTSPRQRCRGSPMLSRGRGRRWCTSSRRRWFHQCRPLLPGPTPP
jgi:hypothetical protein